MTKEELFNFLNDAQICTALNNMDAEEMVTYLRYYLSDFPVMQAVLNELERLYYDNEV